MNTLYPRSELPYLLSAKCKQHDLNTHLVNEVEPEELQSDPYVLDFYNPNIPSESFIKSIPMEPSNLYSSSINTNLSKELNFEED